MISSLISPSEVVNNKISATDTNVLLREQVKKDISRDYEHQGDVIINPSQEFNQEHCCINQSPDHKCLNQQDLECQHLE